MAKLSGAQIKALREIAASDSSSVASATKRALAARGLVTIIGGMTTVTVRRGGNYITREVYSSRAVITDAGRAAL